MCYRPKLLPFRAATRARAASRRASSSFALADGSAGFCATRSEQTNPGPGHRPIVWAHARDGV